VGQRCSPQRQIRLRGIPNLFPWAYSSWSTKLTTCPSAVQLQWNFDFTFLTCMFYVILCIFCLVPFSQILCSHNFTIPQNCVSFLINVPNFTFRNSVLRISYPRQWTSFPVRSWEWLCKSFIGWCTAAFMWYDHAPCSLKLCSCRIFV
jgi:hypothetical protein